MATLTRDWTVVLDDGGPDEVTVDGGGRWLLRLDGADRTPDLAVVDMPHPAGGGTLDLSPLPLVREVVADIGVEGDETALLGVADMLTRLTRPGRLIRVRWRVGGRERMIRDVAVREVTVGADPAGDWGLGLARMLVRMLASDPTIYDPVEQTVTVDADGETVTTGGSAAVWPVLRVTRTGTDPVTVTHVEQGRQVAWQGPTGVQVDIDTRARTVRRVSSGADETAGLILPAGWWQLQPGSQTVTVTGGTAEVRWQDGWWTL